MAGFVALFQADTTPEAREGDFLQLLELTTRFKGLESPDEWATGNGCTAVKLDAPSSLHRGIVRDEQSGSWLMAAGTVLSLAGDNDPHSLLKNLLIDFLNNGSNALEHYDGHFALIIYNGRENSLSVLSDPMGLFAIYYARCGKKVFISTSALAVARQVDFKADTLMIECFLRTGRPHGEKTLWQDVNRVRPAKLIKITPNKFDELEYWTPKVDEHIARLSMNDALEIADGKISRVHEQLFLRGGKVWADLTGGFDTRVTTMFLAKMGIPFTAFCVGSAGHPDVEVSRLVCQQMGWEYRNFQLPHNWAKDQIPWITKAVHHGDGLLNAIQLAGTLFFSRERSLEHPVHVSGGGVDEWRYHNFGAKVIFHSKYSKVNFDDILDARIISAIPLVTLRKDRTMEVRTELKDHFSLLVSNYSDFDDLFKSDIIFRRHRHPIHSGAYLSAEAGIMRALLPFCLKDLVNFGLSIYHYWRIKYHFHFVRNIIEKGSPHLAQISTTNGAPAIPIRLTNISQFFPLMAYLINHFRRKLL